MKNKYLWNNYFKLRRGAVIIVSVFIFAGLVIAKSSIKQDKIEVGDIPSRVVWNKNTYIVTGKTIWTVGKKAWSIRRY